MKRFSTSGILLILCTILVVGISACSAQKKLRKLQKGTLTGVSLQMAGDTAYIPKLREYTRSRERDTVYLADAPADDDVLLMQGKFNEETGEVNSYTVLDAAKVVAPFRHVAERGGKVDIIFQVRVPAEMQESKWQLRFYPDLVVLSDSLRLDPVIITGAGYRKGQLRGYQQYERFLSKIVDDSTRFINLRQLEIFLKRYIPEVYAFKTDSSYVSDEVFASAYGVTEQDAVEHYTDKMARSRNRRRIRDKEKMWNRYVKSPIVTSGIRLDTVLRAPNGEFVYNYVQTIHTRPRLKKAEVWLSGEIYEQDKKLYTIPKGDSLVFYISSVATFADNRERYLTRVIERRAEANTACYVAFAQGSSLVDESMGDNRAEIARIKHNLAELMENEHFELDSIVVRSYASPEGGWAANERLSRSRSESMSAYLNGYIRHYQDSLAREQGFAIDLDGNIVHYEPVRIPFLVRSSGENWKMLDWLIETDAAIDTLDKIAYRSLADIKDLDERERRMQQASWYPYVKKDLYPRLRTVNFDFHLHRKGMVKDTIHTTVLDSVYMRGVQALRDMDYESAIVDLAPYADFNTAVVYTALDRNLSAMAILSQLEATAEVNYLKALIFARMGEDQQAVDHFILSCKQDHSFVHRGNLDPEISVLIKVYGLHLD